ncbi:hypothetical protein DFJ73DRAFT_806828 [Zopfochytrium polystomum]|nr:hypothetical protein DFJ73DRAFT_806828 [Zopfochytrium polystomum]
MNAADAQALMMAQLRDPELRKKLLKKRAPPPERGPAGEPTGPGKLKPRGMTDEEKKMKEDAERNDLFIELLGYMEAPNGNLEELTDKAKSSTSVSRGFVFSLIRRGWVVCYRVSDGLPEGGDKEKLVVFPGREWTRGIKLPDMSEADIKDKFEEGGIIARVHMYRFDDKAKTHVLDELVLVKDKKFPAKPPPFTEKEPPQDTLENRRKWEAWNTRKLDYYQSDFPQFELVFNKLVAQDSTTTGAFNQLQATMIAMRRMADSLRQTFEKFSVAELREIVSSIPTHIKTVMARLQEKQGIIIRGEGLKLTPEFLKSLDLKPKALIEAEKALAKAAADEAAARAKDGNGVGAPTMGKPLFALKDEPLEELLKKLEKSEKASSEEGKIKRLQTYHAGMKGRNRAVQQ